MQTKIIPLGTASAIPTRNRHMASVALWRQGRMLLFDCGEGTQMRLLHASLNRGRIDGIFITHFHGDHFYGLMGILSTLMLLERNDPLTVVGPVGLEEIVRAHPGLQTDRLPYAVEYVELEEDFERAVVMDAPDYRVTARPVEHRIFTIGYRFQEKARPGHLDVERANALGVTDYAHYRQLKAGEAVTLEDGRTVQPGEVIGPERPGSSFAYVMDTRPCAGGRALAEQADLLYHEATFTDEMHDRAVETGHSTAREAAEVAQSAGARRLLVSHFSARYQETAPLVEEARQTFPNTDAARELKRYVLNPDDVTRERTG